LSVPEEQQKKGVNPEVIPTPEGRICTAQFGVRCAVTWGERRVEGGAGGCPPLTETGGQEYMILSPLSYTCETHSTRRARRGVAASLAALARQSPQRDPNTNRFKRTLIDFNTDTQYGHFR